ncbi:MAG TPA: HlyD family secretion protein [Caulobacteraceae bacterium]|jgi:membrane fusion protein (multidrug efflux system)|nr:HlyD family secretion protein [Caulobacteraceae bacterium]
MTVSADSELDERSRPRPEAPAPGPEIPQARSDDAAGPPPAPPRVSRPWVRRGLFLLLPVALIGGAVWYVTGGRVTSMDDAYVEADKVGVSTDVSGIVSEVDVRENQPVKAGQVLYRLRDLPFQLALARADAQLGMVRDSLNALKANYRDMQAQIKQGQGDVQYFSTEAGRQQTLLAAHVASQSASDTAGRNLQNAQQKLASLDQQLAAIGANLNGDPGGAVERNPRYLEAVAQRDEAARELADTVVRAPFAGVVTNVPSIAPGKYLAASTTAFDLVHTDYVWVDANPKETQLTYVRPGQPATVTVDAYPGMSWTGVVDSISPAAAQEFSLLPAQNTSGNWVKVVQRIAIRVRVDTRGRSLPPLHAGMSAEVGVDTGHQRGLPRFLSGMFGHDRRGR